MVCFKSPKLFKFQFFIIVWALFPGVLMAAMTLSMQQAEQLALNNDLLMKSHNEYAMAFQQQSIASQQWPDGQIKLGVQALPIDSFELDQEPMTQVIMAYSQMVPRGDSQLYETELMLAKSDMAQAEMKVRKRQVRLSVRQAWINAYLQKASEEIIRQNRRLFKQQLEVSQSLYSAGRSHQQDVLQAELELSLIDDKLQKISSRKNVARAALSRWVGDEYADYELVDDENELELLDKKNFEQLLLRVKNNPVIIKYNAKINASHKKLALAEQKYKTQWGFEVSYGKRSGENPDDSERADFFSGMVKMDVPIFTENKQDRILASRKKQLQASKYEQQDKVLLLRNKVKQIFVHIEKLKTRLYLYDDKVLPQARENAKAALNGYQSGVLTFSTLTRARSAELKAQLQRLELYNEKALAYAQMRFVVGEEE